MQNPIPDYMNPDGVGTALNTAFHCGLGSGIVYNTFLVNPLPPDQICLAQRLQYYDLPC